MILAASDLRVQVANGNGASLGLVPILGSNMSVGTRTGRLASNRRHQASSARFEPIGLIMVPDAWPKNEAPKIELLFPESFVFWRGKRLRPESSAIQSKDADRSCVSSTLLTANR
jgi:hypothetical protein